VTEKVYYKLSNFTAQKIPSITQITGQMPH